MIENTITAMERAYRGVVRAGGKPVRIVMGGTAEMAYRAALKEAGIDPPWASPNCELLFKGLPIEVRIDVKPHDVFFLPEGV